MYDVGTKKNTAKKKTAANPPEPSHDVQQLARNALVSAGFAWRNTEDERRWDIVLVLSALRSIVGPLPLTASHDRAARATLRKLSTAAQAYLNVHAPGALDTLPNNTTFSRIFFARIDRDLLAHSSDDRALARAVSEHAFSAGHRYFGTAMPALMGSDDDPVFARMSNEIGRAIRKIRTGLREQELREMIFDAALRGLGFSQARVAAMRRNYTRHNR